MKNVSQRRVICDQGFKTMRRNALLRGFWPNGTAVWRAEEDDIVRKLYPDYDLLREALPHRTESALRQRGGKLELQTPINFWTQKQIDLLRKHYSTAPTVDLERLIGVKRSQIYLKAISLKLTRPRYPYVPTGDDLLDSLRARCWELRITMADLDELAGTGNYFHCRQWAGGETRPNWHPVAKVAQGIRAIGGKLDVVWDEKRVIVDRG